MSKHLFGKISWYFFNYRGLNNIPFNQTISFSNPSTFRYFLNFPTDFTAAELYIDVNLERNLWWIAFTIYLPFVFRILKDVSVHNHTKKWCGLVLPNYFSASFLWLATWSTQIILSLQFESSSRSWSWNSFKTADRTSTFNEPLLSNPHPI